jgi:SAM-dependent methyltransferase
MDVLTWDSLIERLSCLEGRVPNAQEYREMSDIVIEHPLARDLANMDPFSAEYRDAAMKLYLNLRGRGNGGYDVARDECTQSTMPPDLWTGLPPWSFRDPRLISEFVFSWAQIMRLLEVKPGDHVIEYGPGSGQLLLMLARSGVKAYGVDINEPSLAAIREQARILQLDVSLERNVFGEGFGEQIFDGIVFFEAFHHAFDFEFLLRRLRERVRLGGRIVLSGEPVVPHPIPHVPYPWGPRLDGLSIFCIRRYGWMELGFTQNFLSEAFWRAGWQLESHPFPLCVRAAAYVATRLSDQVIATLNAERDAAEAGRRRAELERDAAEAGRRRAELERDAAETARRCLEAERNQALALVDAFRSSTSWRVTTPIRWLGAASTKFKRSRRNPR